MSTTGFRTEYFTIHVLDMLFTRSGANPRIANRRVIHVSNHVTYQPEIYSLLFLNVTLDILRPLYPVFITTQPPNCHFMTPRNAFTRCVRYAALMARRLGLTAHETAFKKLPKSLATRQQTLSSSNALELSIVRIYIHHCVLTTTSRLRLIFIIFVGLGNVGP